jgi:hypothetical protein
LKFRTERSPAPGELVVVQGFLNTWSAELEIEDLKTPAKAESWLRQAGLWKGRGRLEAAEHRAVVEFRSKLRACITSNDGFGPIENAMSTVRFRAEGSTPGLISFVPEGDSLEKLTGKLVAIVATSINNGTWTRLKCCGLPSCGWAFYDSTRSRTRRWCSMKTCGSRHKSREYYRRKTGKSQSQRR